MDDSQEAFVRWENAHPARQRVSLHKALAQVLTEHLDDAAAFGIRELIPLKVPSRVRQCCIQLVAL